MTIGGNTINLAGDVTFSKFEVRAVYMAKKDLPKLINFVEVRAKLLRTTLGQPIVLRLNLLGNIEQVLSWDSDGLLNRRTLNLAAV